MEMRFGSIKAFFFDLDGVLSIGKTNPRYLSGREVVSNIRSSGKKTFVLTNDSTQVREEIQKNLTRLGFDFGLDEILTSSSLTASYLHGKFGRASFFLVGEEGLRRELELAGHVEAKTQPDVVVVGLDRGLTYGELDDALRFLKKGAQLIGSYGGAVYMSDHGPALSAGPITKALEYASGKRAVMIGKPSPRMFRLAAQLAHEKPARCVMVGDQVETDILGAKRAGVHTILVLTGVETRETAKLASIQPDMIVEDVDRLLKYL
jgi:HAD superfamily hydrolase (TIGR01450 family)